MRWGPDLDALAATQHWLLTTEQLRDAGVAERTIRRWVAKGLIERRQPGVVAPAGTPRSRHQPLVAALLSAGPEAAVSHRRAVAEWGFDPGGLHVIELTIPRLRNHPPRGAVVHRLTDLHEGHVTVRDGYRITTPARSLVDYGAVVPPWMVTRATSRAIADDHCTEADIESVLDVVGRRGRDGAGVMREVLGSRSPDVLTGASRLEKVMARVVRIFHLPRPVFQYPVIAEGRKLKIDFAYPLVMLALEVDGYAWHRTLEQFQDDDERQNILVELGFTVLRFTWHDVTQRPRAVAGRVERMLARLSAPSPLPAKSG